MQQKNIFVIDDSLEKMKTDFQKIKKKLKSNLEIYFLCFSSCVIEKNKPYLKNFSSQSNEF